MIMVDDDHVGSKGIWGVDMGIRDMFVLHSILTLCHYNKQYGIDGDAMTQRFDLKTSKLRSRWLYDLWWMFRDVSNFDISMVSIILFEYFAWEVCIDLVTSEEARLTRWSNVMERDVFQIKSCAEGIIDNFEYDVCFVTQDYVRILTCILDYEMIWLILGDNTYGIDKRWKSNPSVT